MSERRGSESDGSHLELPPPLPRRSGSASADDSLASSETPTVVATSGIISGEPPYGPSRAPKRLHPPPKPKAVSHQTPPLPTLEEDLFGEYPTIPIPSGDGGNDHPVSPVATRPLPNDLLDAEEDSDPWRPSEPAPPSDSGLKKAPIEPLNHADFDFESWDRPDKIAKQ
jgi:hypothetical protein